MHSRLVLPNPRRLVGQRIRQYRKKRGWSQEKLGEEANLHRTYIGQVERGEKSIGIDNLFKIANALGISASDLVR
ncbi:MAG: helix-turn-helix transcriptional regulator [candidate division WOR-3 bacterium]